jgi:flavin reductase (DIM6/NTAB) family NADH-FMN oxidoreductase RutF
MSVDSTMMRDTLRLWASGVSIVATSDGTQRAGMTVSAFNSLCLEPPLVLVCLFKDTVTADLVQSAGVFSVSILHADQIALSDRFAGRVELEEGEDRFDGVPVFEAETGSPIIQGAIAWLDCRVTEVHDGVSHWIVIGETVAAGYRTDDTAPLLYFDRDYREVQRQTEAFKD